MTVGANRGYDGVPELYPDLTEHRRMLARAVNRLTGGKLNCSVDVTLRSGQVTTPISDSRIASTSFIAWMPQTASASAAEKAGMWVSARTKGSAVLNHTSSAAVDQDFTILVLG